MGTDDYMMIVGGNRYRKRKLSASEVSNYTLSAIALKIEPCLVIMEEIAWKQEVFTLKAKSANNGIELFHPLAVPSTPESDMLTVHLLLPSLGIPGTAGDQAAIHCSPRIEK